MSNPTPQDSWNNNLHKITLKIEHDFNNHLTNIYSLCDLHSNSHPDPDTLKEALNSIKSAAHSSQTLLKRISHLLDPTTDAPHALDIQHFLEQHTPLFQIITGKHTKISLPTFSTTTFSQTNPTHLRNTLLDILLHIGRLEKITFSLDQSFSITLECHLHTKNNPNERLESIKEHLQHYPDSTLSIDSHEDSILFTLPLQTLTLEHSLSEQTQTS